MAEGVYRVRPQPPPAQRVSKRWIPTVPTAAVPASLLASQRQARSRFRRYHRTSWEHRQPARGLATFSRPARSSLQLPRSQPRETLYARISWRAVTRKTAGAILSRPVKASLAQVSRRQPRSGMYKRIRWRAVLRRTGPAIMSRPVTASLSPPYRPQPRFTVYHRLKWRAVIRKTAMAMASRPARSSLALPAKYPPRTTTYKRVKWVSPRNRFRRHVFTSTVFVPLSWVPRRTQPIETLYARVSWRAVVRKTAMAMASRPARASLSLPPKWPPRSTLYKRVKWISPRNRLRRHVHTSPVVIPRSLVPRRTQPPETLYARVSWRAVLRKTAGAAFSRPVKASLTPARRPMILFYRRKRKPKTRLKTFVGSVPVVTRSLPTKRRQSRILHPRARTVRPRRFDGTARRSSVWKRKERWPGTPVEWLTRKRDIRAILRRRRWLGTKPFVPGSIVPADLDISRSQTTTLTVSETGPNVTVAVSRSQGVTLDVSEDERADLVVDDAQKTSLTVS